MADGFRFNPGGPFFTLNQNAHARGVPRNCGSPISTTRALFQPNPDTPSPNRSPGTQSPAHNPYSMFNQHGHRQNHGMLNGVASHNYQMNIHKTYANQSHAASHHMNHQDHASIVGAQYALGHQHSSSGGALANSTPNFTPAHLQNGTPDSAGALSKPPNAHWAEQLREYTELEQAAKVPHYYARHAPHVNRTPAATLSSLSTVPDGDEHGDRRKAPEPEDSEEPGSWGEMDLGGQGLKSMGASIFRCYPGLRKIYFNHNRLRALPIRIGEMRALTVLDLSFNQLSSLPAEIGMLTNLKRLLLYGNYLVDLPSEVGFLHRLEMLGIEGNRGFNPDLKERLIEYGTKEVVRYLREESAREWIGEIQNGHVTDYRAAPAPPLDREWISLTDETESELEKFTVFSWNVLCDRGATQAQFGWTPSQALSWDHRKQVISDEVRARNADILALQEIDQESYNEYFRPTLAMEDYRGFFWPKTRAQTMGEKEAKIVDGCAIFWKHSKYLLLDKQLIAYSREALNRPDMKGDHDVYNRVMPRDNIAVVAFLENRTTGSRLIVVNTHLVWEGSYADVKVVQVALLLEHLAKLVENYSRREAATVKEVFKFANEDSVEGTDTVRPELAPSQSYDSGTQIPLVICGDFNSTMDSGVYDLITQGSLSNSHVDLGTQNYGDFTKKGMNHPFSLKSAYSNIRDWPWTNYVPHFREVIDYIWYSTNTLQCTGLLGRVDPEYMRKVPGFPNWHFPSDHLALLAEFVVKSRKEKRKPVEADFGNSSRRENGRQ
jgi:CCR4-NOT transcription complex subunit 6